MGSLLIAQVWTNVLLRIASFYVGAWLVSLLAWRLADMVLHLGFFAPKRRRPRPQRRATLRNLLASAIRTLALVLATLAAVGQFAPMETLVWLVGLFSVAFGLGARPLVSDFMTGIYLIFEDTFSVGDKIEVLEIEGVVEVVNLRTTTLQGPAGDIYVIPNGEIRVVRNFSRGRFSRADIRLRLASGDLKLALPLLSGLGREAVRLLPDLLEPWKVITKSGVVGEHAELTLVAKARFGEAAELRPLLLALVQERLARADIELVD